MDRSRLFDHEYEAILADTPEGRKIHHQIRYRVFCEETGFEDQEAFPNHEETDQWDHHSVPFIVRTRQTREWVATIRLILPGASLPSQELCMLDRGAIAKIKPHEVAELSRLCVVQSFRGRRYTDPVREPRRPVNSADQSQIILGLLRACSAYSREQNIRYWYLLTTKSLARMMTRLHLPLHPIGTAIEHRGKRYPFLANVEKSRRYAKQKCPCIAKMLLHPTPYLRFSELSGEPADPVWDEAAELALDWSA